MSKPRVEPAQAITNWLMALGWKTVVVTENFVLAITESRIAAVWCRHRISENMGNRIYADHDDHEETINLIENIANKALKGATK